MGPGVGCPGGPEVPASWRTPAARVQNSLLRSKVLAELSKGQDGDFSELPALFMWLRLQTEVRNVKQLAEFHLRFASVVSY